MNNKPWITAILSTSLVFTGAVTLAPNAFANNSDADQLNNTSYQSSAGNKSSKNREKRQRRALTEAQSNKVTKVKEFDFDAILNNRLSTLAWAASTLTDEESERIRDHYDEGQTIAKATLRDASELLPDLLQPVVEQITAAEKAGILTKEEASVYENEARNAILNALNSPVAMLPKQEQVREVEVFNFKEVLNERLSSLSWSASMLTSEENEWVRDRYNAGQTIAEATLRNASVLLPDLIQPVLDQIAAAQRAGIISSGDASSYENEARNAILDALNSPVAIKDLK